MTHPEPGRRTFIKTASVATGALLTPSLAGSAPASADAQPKDQSAATAPPTQVDGVNAASRRRAAVIRARMTGKKALLEQLVADGVIHIFGNPGSTEQGFMDALADFPQLRYVLGLHEGVVVGMADAYAKMSGRPAFVQLHTIAGLGNATGALYNALHTRAPLVVYAGLNETGVLFQEPNLSGPVVELARPVTKWAARVDHAHDVPQAIRRAFKVAAEPPAGPVFIALPLDTLEGEAQMEIRPTEHTATRSSPDVAALAEMADRLLVAEKPMIMVGDGVAEARAQSEAVQIAELLGAPIFALTSATRLNAPASHPLNQGSVFYVFPKDLRETLSDCDCLLAVGASLFPVTFLEPGKAILKPDTSLLQIGTDAWEIGKNVTPTVSILADPKVALASLASAIDRRRTSSQADTARRRGVQITERLRAERERLATQGRREWDVAPISAARLMNEIARALPANATVVSEGLSNEHAVERGIVIDDPLGKLKSGGPGIGGGLPGAIGAQLALPDRKVVAVCSDGAAMYSIAALWSASHHNVPVTFVMLNNGAYHVLKTTLLQSYGAAAMRGRPFVGMDLSPPALRFDRIAGSMGVRAWRVEKPDDLAGVLQEAFAHRGEPTLVDVAIAAPLT